MITENMKITICYRMIILIVFEFEAFLLLPKSYY